MTQMQLALCFFLSGSVCLFLTTLERVVLKQTDILFARAGAVLFVIGSLILW